ncbi:MAG: hypothetical protein WCP20_11905 [Desulfuromonadales bacterium]
MKKTNPQAGNHAEKRRRFSIKATLNAIMGMSYSHFPLILPGVHPLLAPLIMYRLKRRGYSNCRVEIAGGGLIVYAVK